LHLINKDSKILIVGDSWGCGEWPEPFKRYDSSHSGLEFYLKEYRCDVTNVSRGGYSNENIFNSLKDQMHHSYDVILWFQTDPIRNLRPFADNLEIFKKEKEDFISAHDGLLDSVYEKFNSLGIPIYCLGGACKLDLVLLEKYSNLIPIIPSIIEMLGGKHIRIWPSGDWITSKETTSVFSYSLTDYLYHECKIDLDKTWFYPDGRHPNREAHKKIFEYLVDFKLPD